MLNQPLLSMKRITLVDIISALLLCFYLFTAINSFFQIESLKNLLAFYTLHTTTVAWSLVALETCIALLLFFRKTRMAGIIAAFCMLFFAGVTIKEYPRYPHDFGGLFNLLNSKQDWYLIVVLGCLCLMAIALMIVGRGPNIQPPVSKPKLV